MYAWLRPGSGWCLGMSRTWSSSFLCDVVFARLPGRLVFFDLTGDRQEEVFLSSCRDELYANRHAVDEAGGHAECGESQNVPTASQREQGVSCAYRGAVDLQGPGSEDWCGDRQGRHGQNLKPGEQLGYDGVDSVPGLDRADVFPAGGLTGCLQPSQHLVVLQN